MSLHTRSLKYGKLQGGMLVEVSPCLMKRLKQHFHTFDFGVNVIFGMNGYVWVSTQTGALESDELNDVSASAQEKNRSGTGGTTMPPTREERERICRVRNALVALNRLCIAVSPASVTEVYQSSVAAGLHVKQMLMPQVMASICASALACHGERTAQLGLRHNST